MLLSFSACGFNLIYVLGQTHIHNDDDDDVESQEPLTNAPSPPVHTPAARTKNSAEKEGLLTRRRTHRAAVIYLAVTQATRVPERMKKMPETKARMVRWGWMWPMLLMTKAVKTKSSDTMGNGVAVLTISAGRRGSGVQRIS